MRSEKKEELFIELKGTKKRVALALKEDDIY